MLTTLHVDGCPDASPHRIRVAMARQRWEVVTMLHWRVPARVVEELVPPGLRADTFDGSAWASLTPLRMAAVTTPPLPPVPVISTFCETNVRTYVIGPSGPAIWFCSLDIPRLLGVPPPRVIGQPYAWSRMRISQQAEELRYWSQRLLPGPRGTTSHVGVRIGQRQDLDELDRWLVNRWGSYSLIARRLAYTPLAHAPWRLRQAEVVLARDGLSAAAGLPIGTVERAHHAPRTPGVTFGLPRLV